MKKITRRNFIVGLASLPLVNQFIAWRPEPKQANLHWHLYQEIQPGCVRVSLET